MNEYCLFHYYNVGINNIDQTRKPKSVKSFMLDFVITENTQFMEAPSIELFGGLEVKWIFVPTCQQFHQGSVGITCYSVTSERVFSTAGNIISSQRECRLPDNANMLIFIKHNKTFHCIFK